MNRPLTYDQFVRGVLRALCLVLPQGVSPELSFSGSMDAGRKPGPDMAVLGGRRAITFLSTLALSADVVGVSPDDYEVSRTLLTDIPLVSHAAYARNLRRWERGTLPRKCRARADFVVVATCWLAGWEDGHEVEPERMAEAWVLVGELIGEMPYDPDDRKGIAEALWMFSTKAYEASLAKRRATRDN